MSDYIKREDAINIKDYLKRFGCFGDFGFVEIEGVLIALSKIPSADVAPVRHGRWIEYGENKDGTHNIRCSKCGAGLKSKGHANSYYTKRKYRYCPNCGARMDAKE